MSTSIMSPQMMVRTIFIFTLMTGVAYSLIKDKPNTFWSKRTGHTEFSDFILNDSQDDSKVTERNMKILSEHPSYKERRNILSQKIQSNGNLPLHFLRLSSFLRKIKYVINKLDMDKF